MKRDIAQSVVCVIISYLSVEFSFFSGRGCFGYSWAGSSEWFSGSLALDAFPEDDTTIESPARKPNFRIWKL
jgi:hypothetical protein